MSRVAELTDRVFLFQDDTEKMYLVYSPGDGRVIPYDSRWSFNGDYKSPTFSPSMLSHGDGHLHKRSHFFLTNGRISYLNDCEHDMRGKIVECPTLAEWPESEKHWIEELFNSESNA